MPQYAAFLRGINVGGNRRISMEALRGFMVELGFPSARTLLQSGNIVFESSGRTPGALEALLEAGARERLGMDTPFYVRTASEWTRLVKANPFSDEAREDPARLIVLLLKDRPTPSRIRDLQATIAGREVVRAGAREAYIYYPDGMGRSKLTVAILDRLLGRGTARNWNTVLKLGAMFG
jgi:uncharacterized protein (DUF1697 family)